MKTLTVKNGRWQIGNLYDKLVADKFDFFINSHRVEEIVTRVGLTKKDNYQFNFKK